MSTEHWVVPLEYGQWIVYTSTLLIPPSFLHALFCNHLILSFYCFTGFFTSVIYWKKPLYGFRRNADILCMITALSTHLYSAWRTPAWKLYISLVSIAASMYPISFYMQSKGFIRESMICHLVLHFFAFLSNNSLYYYTCPKEYF
jgi:hypothetical protein